MGSSNSYATRWVVDHNHQFYDALTWVDDLNSGTIPFTSVATMVSAPFVPYAYEYRESRDRGTTWTELPGQFTRQRLYPDPRDPKVLYLSGAGGVRKSRDGGSTWFDVSTGLDEWSAIPPTGNGF